MATLNIDLDTTAAETQLNTLKDKALKTAKEIKGAFANLKLDIFGNNKSGFASILQDVKDVKTAVSKVEKSLSGVSDELKTQGGLMGNFAEDMQKLGYKVATVFGKVEDHIGDSTAKMRNYRNEVDKNTLAWGKNRNEIQAHQRAAKEDGDAMRWMESNQKAATRAQKANNLEVDDYVQRVKIARKYMDKYGESAVKVARQAAKAWKLGKEDAKALMADLVHTRKDVEMLDNAFGQLHTRMRKTNASQQLMNKSWTKFSVAMSGIAATLFVFQNIARGLGSLLGVGMGLEKTMAGLNQNAALTKSQYEMLIKTARHFGSTTSMSAKDALKSLKTMMEGGKSAGEAVSALYKNFERNEAANRGIKTLDDSISKFINKLTELNYKFFDLFGYQMKKGLDNASRWIEDHESDLIAAGETLIGLGKGFVVLAKDAADAASAIGKIAAAYDKLAKASGSEAGSSANISAAVMAGLAAGWVTKNPTLGAATSGSVYAYNVAKEIGEKLNEKGVKEELVRKALPGSVISAYIADLVIKFIPYLEKMGMQFENVGAKGDEAFNGVRMSINRAKEDTKVALEVIKVIDGDTLDLRTNGIVIPVRLSGADTDESKRGAENNTLMGELASKFTKEWIKEGDEIKSELAALHGKYDREIADLFYEGTNVGEQLLSLGLAKLLEEYPSQYNELFEKTLKNIKPEIKQFHKELQAYMNEAGVGGFEPGGWDDRKKQKIDFIEFEKGKEVLDIFIPKLMVLNKKLIVTRELDEMLAEAQGKTVNMTKDQFLRFGELIEVLSSYDAELLNVTETTNKQFELWQKFKDNPFMKNIREQVAALAQAKDTLSGWLDDPRYDQKSSLFDPNYKKFANEFIKAEAKRILDASKEKEQIQERESKKAENEKKRFYESMIELDRNYSSKAASLLDKFTYGPYKDSVLERANLAFEAEAMKLKGIKEGSKETLQIIKRGQEVALEKLKEGYKVQVEAEKDLQRFKEYAGKKDTAFQVEEAAKKFELIKKTLGDVTGLEELKEKVIKEIRRKGLEDEKKVLLEKLNVNKEYLGWIKGEFSSEYIEVSNEILRVQADNLAARKTQLGEEANAEEIFTRMVMEQDRDRLLAKADYYDGIKEKSEEARAARNAADKLTEKIETVKFGDPTAAAKKYTQSIEKPFDDVIAKIQGAFSGEIFGDSEDNVFGNMLKSLNDMVTTFQTLVDPMTDLGKMGATLVEQQKELNSLLEVQRDLEQDGRSLGTDKIERIKDLQEQIEIGSKKTFAGQLEGYAAMAGAASQFFGQLKQQFDETSAEYKAFAMAEKISGIANILLKAATAIINAGANGDGYTAIARMVAVAAAVASVLSQVGLSIAGPSGSDATPPTAEMTAGSTLYGVEEGAPSESLMNSFEFLEDVGADQYDKLVDIYQELRELNMNIMGLVTSIIKTGSVENLELPEMMDSSLSEFTKNFVQITTLIGGGLGIDKLVGGLISKIAGWLFGGEVTFETVEAGLIQLNKVGTITMDNLIAGVDKLGVHTYLWYKQITDNGVFGSDDEELKWKYGENPLEDASRLITKIVVNIGESMLELADILGFGANVIEAINNYAVDLGRVNLQGLDAEGISDALNAWFSNFADEMAGAVFGELLKMYQEPDEGLYETAIRLATEKELFMTILDMTGNTFNGTATEAVHLSQAILDLAGDMDVLLDDVGAYYDAFLTKSEQHSILLGTMSGMFSNLELSMPATREGFKELISSIDITTEKGQKLYIGLLNISEAMGQYYDEVEEATETLLDLKRSLSETDMEASIRGLIDSWNDGYAALAILYGLASSTAAGLAEEIPESTLVAQKEVDRLQKEMDEIQNLEGMMADAIAGVNLDKLKTFFSDALLALEDGFDEDNFEEVVEQIKGVVDSWVSGANSALDALEGVQERNTIHGKASVFYVEGIDEYIEDFKIFKESMADFANGLGDLDAESLLTSFSDFAGDIDDLRSRAKEMYDNAKGLGSQSYLESVITYLDSLSASISGFESALSDESTNIKDQARIKQVLEDLGRGDFSSAITWYEDEIDRLNKTGTADELAAATTALDNLKQAAADFLEMELEQLDAIKLELGLITSAQYTSKRLDEINTKYAQFNMSAEQMVDTFAAMNLDQLKAVAEQLGIEWTDIAKDMAFLVAQEQKLYDIRKAQAELQGKDTGLWEISERYGLNYNNIDEAFASKMVKQFLSMTAEQIRDWAKALGVSSDQLVSDMMTLANAFDLVGDTVASVAAEIRENLQSIREQIMTDMGGNGSASTASRIWGQITDLQGQETVTEGTLLEMTELLGDWYSSAKAAVDQEAQNRVMYYADENSAGVEMDRDAAQALMDAANELEQVADQIASLVDSIDGIIESIKYSSLNVSLPYQKADASSEDYFELKAKAFAEDATIADVEKFTGFAQTYLEQQQAEYKSSDTYTDIYGAVMADLEAVKAKAESGGYDQAILDELRDIGASIEDIEPDYSGIAAQFESMAAWIESSLSHLERMEFLVEFDWSTFTGSAAEAMSMLMELVDEYGWGNSITLTFISDMGAWAAEDINRVIYFLEKLNGDDWTTTAAITFVGAVAANLQNLTDAKTVLDYMVANAGGWNSEVIITFLDNINMDIFETMEQKMAAIGYVAAETDIAHGYISEALMTFLARMSDEGDVAWADIKKTLIYYGADDATAIKTLQTLWLKSTDMDTWSWETFAERWGLLGDDVQWAEKHLKAMYEGNIPGDAETWSKYVLMFDLAGVDPAVAEKTLKAIYDMSDDPTLPSLWSEFDAALQQNGILPGTTAYKTIQAEYNAQYGFDSWSDLEAALDAAGISPTVTKTIESQYTNNGGMTVAELQSLLSDSGVPESIIRNITTDIQGTVEVELTQAEVWEAQLGALTGILQNTVEISKALGGGYVSTGSIVDAFYSAAIQSLGGAWSVTAPGAGDTSTGGEFPAGVGVTGTALNVHILSAEDDVHLCNTVTDSINNSLFGSTTPGTNITAQLTAMTTGNTTYGLNALHNAQVKMHTGDTVNSQKAIKDKIAADYTAMTTGNTTYGLNALHNAQVKMHTGDSVNSQKAIKDVVNAINSKNYSPTVTFGGTVTFSGTVSGDGLTSTQSSYLTDIYNNTRLYNYTSNQWEGIDTSMGRGFSAVDTKLNTIGSNIYKLYKALDGGTIGGYITVGPSNYYQAMTLNGAIGQSVAYPGYGDGGISWRPEYALVGEKGPEAHVPLKDGAIPVELSGMGGLIAELIGSMPGDPSEFGIPLNENVSLAKNFFMVNSNQKEGSDAKDERPIYITVEVAGKEFEADVKAWADDVRVTANRTKGNETRRLYR